MWVSGRESERMGVSGGERIGKAGTREKGKAVVVKWRLRLKSDSKPHGEGVQDYRQRPLPPPPSHTSQPPANSILHWL